MFPIPDLVLCVCIVWQCRNSQKSRKIATQRSHNSAPKTGEKSVPPRQVLIVIYHISQNIMGDSNGFAFYSGEPTPMPSPVPIGALATPAPTYEYESTPWPTYDPGDQNYDDDDEMTPLMRAYATIGFIIRIFLPIILIVMCCRLKRRGEFADLGGAGGGGRAQDGFVSGGGTRMDPDERKRYVEERLCSKVRQ